jgi:uncharacterized protein
VQPIQVDLRTPDGVAKLYSGATSLGRPLDAVALNAGIGQGGAFVETDLADLQAVIDLNVIATVHLAHVTLRDMVARGEGRLLITSSIAATMPGAFQAIYNASKSFEQSLAEALQQELKNTGVTVTSFMPGPTDTKFFARAHLEHTAMGKGPKDDPAQVAKQGFEALMKGEEKLTAGSLITKVQGAANKVLPDKLKAAGHRQMAKPRH